MKTGLVLEGGAMRGMYTAGVLDVLMEHQIEVDGAIGVSAGAVFGCNLKSKQPGRVIRYNKRFCRDPRYASFRSLVRTGDLYGADFCYHQIPDNLDPFDGKTYRENPMEFYVVCTDVDTGEAIYHRCDTGDATDVQWMRASASMPLVSQLIRLDNRLLSDGGTADSIPLRYFQSLGYTRNIVILTQPEGYRKKRNRYLPLLRLCFRSHPAIVDALANRHIHYNETLDYIRAEEAAGRVLALRPSRALEIGRVEHDPEKLEAVYQIGRSDAEKKLPEIRAFLSAAKTATAEE